MNIEKRKRILKKVYSLVDGVVLFMDYKGYIIESSDSSMVGNYLELPEFEKESEAITHKGWTLKQINSAEDTKNILAINNKKQTTIPTIQIVSMLFEEEMDHLTKDEVIIDYLKGNIAEDRILQVASGVIVDLEESNTVVILEIQKNYLDEVDSILRNILEDVAEVIQFDNNRFVVVFQDELIDDWLILMMSAIAEELLFEPRIGVGMRVDSFLKMKESFRSAEIAIRIAKGYGIADRISYYRNLALPILIEDMDMQELTQLYKAISVGFHNVIDDEELILTARRFFENSLNVTDTAQLLFIHRNTLIYRLHKIEKLTGLDIRKFEDALNFYIGYYMHSRVNS